MTYSADLAARALPARPNLEHLKNEAKQRLEAARKANPRAKLSDVQFKLAREYGFSSWRDLRAGIEAMSLKPGLFDAAGDWMGKVGIGRFALHLSRDAAGGYDATTDSPDTDQYGVRADGVHVDKDRLSFSHLDMGILYEARWHAASEAWVGEWRQNGMVFPMTLIRGVIPPHPSLQRLDGLWDGILDGEEGEQRFTFRIRTDEHGTFGKLYSPDGAIQVAPLKALRREGDIITFEMRSFVVSGPLSADGNTIAGLFRKGEHTAPLALTRRALGAAAPQKRQPAALGLPPDVLGRYVGAYGFSQGRVLTVRLQGDRLMTDSDGDFALCLTPVSETEFRYPVGESALVFQVDGGGRVTGVQRRLEGWTEMGKRLT